MSEKYGDYDHELDTDRMSVRRIIQELRGGGLCLPEFQRGYVWKPNKAATLLDSLHRRLPVGALLVWETSEKIFERGGQKIGVRRASFGSAKWLIDGQQRARTLEKVHQPEGEGVDGLDIYFNVIDATYARGNAAIRNDGKWVRVADVWDADYRRLRDDLRQTFPQRESRIEANIERCRAILDYEVPIIVMRDHRFDDALLAFTRVNTSGVRLKGDDIKAAQIAGKHSGFISGHVVPQMNELRRTGLDRLYLAHVLNACVALARPDKLTSELVDLETSDLRKAWDRAMKGLEKVRHLLSAEFGLSNMSLLWSGSLLIPPLVMCATQSPRERDARQIASWIALAALAHRYSAASATALEQDLKAAVSEDPMRGLLRNLRKHWSKLRADESDFDTSLQDRGALFAAYVACRHQGAKDLFTGQRIEDRMGSNSVIDRHHIIPRATFSPEKRRDADVVANIAFILKDTNGSIGKDAPSDYLTRVSAERLKAQCIPVDKDIWKKGKHSDFWGARRQLLADSFNDFVQEYVGAAT